MPGETVRNTYKHFCLPTVGQHILQTISFLALAVRYLKRNATNAILKIGIYMHDNGCYLNLLD